MEADSQRTNKIVTTLATIHSSTMNFPRWLLPPHLEHKEQTRLARILFTILISISVIEIALILAIPLLFPENPLIALIFMGLAFFYTVGCYFLLQAGQIKISSFLFLGFLGGLTLGASLISNGLDSFTIPLFTVVILAAGLVLGVSYSLTFALLGSLAVAVIFYVGFTGLVAASETVVPDSIKLAIPIFVFISSALILAYLSRNYETALRHAQQTESALEKEKSERETIHASLEQQVKSHMLHLQASLEMGQLISSNYDLDSLGPQAINKLMDFFDCEYGAIYLIDPTHQWAILQYSSEDLSTLPEHAHKLETRALSPLGTAIRYRKLHPVHITNPADYPDFIFLPHIQSVIVVPLFAAGRINGLLTLQSTKSMAFAPHLDILQNVANQIAIAIENATLFQENQNQLHEINRLNQFYLQTTWRDLLSQHSPTFLFSSGKVQETDTPDFSALETAQKEHKVHVTQENGVSTLIAPILFQKQVLGAITLKTPERIWTTDELNLIESVLNQTALSLENTRLFIETRHRAEQEKMLSEISNRMRETLDIETILQTTVREMQKALQLSEVEVYLLPGDSPDRETSELNVEG